MISKLNITLYIIVIIIVITISIINNEQNNEYSNQISKLTIQLKNANHDITVLKQQIARHTEFLEMKSNEISKNSIVINDFKRIFKDVLDHDELSKRNIDHNVPSEIGFAKAINIPTGFKVYHDSLPIGTPVRITHIRTNINCNGRIAGVLKNAPPKRLINYSQDLAECLNVHNDLAKIKLEVLEGK